MSQSGDDHFIHHSDNYFCYTDPADDDAASMYKINSNDIGIATAKIRTASITTTSTRTNNQHVVYHDNWDDHDNITTMTALQTIRNTSCDINFNDTAIV